MSWNPALEPGNPETGSLDAIETLIIPRSRDLGGFEVRRALPAPKRQMVGPFIFFDQMGPVEFLTGQGIDVRPHPHIGLATVTYLFDGEFQHRDSLGTNQMIHPGAVNWMTAGRGVTHSERTSEATRQGKSNLFGIQTWVALPENREDMPAEFEHHGKEQLPLIEGSGIKIRLILGDIYGERAPVTTHSETFYADALLEPGSRMPLPDNHEDRAIYVIEGSVEIAGQTHDKNAMMVFRPGDRITIRAGERGARLMLLGGATLEGPRHIWWNFVSSSREKIEEAKQSWKKGDWEQGLFRLPPDDMNEFIPLP